MPEHGPARVAEAGVGRKPRRHARPLGDRHGRTRRDASGVGADGRRAFSVKPTLLEELSPLRLLLVLDNLAGHKPPNSCAGYLSTASHPYIYP